MSSRCRKSIAASAAGESCLPRQAARGARLARAAPLARGQPASAGTATPSWCAAESRSPRPNRSNCPRSSRAGRCARDLRVEGHALRVVGMHLDLSGLRRMHQIEAMRAHMHGRKGAGGAAGRLQRMGDPRRAPLRRSARVGPSWRPAAAIPAGVRLAQLDRIVHSCEWRCEGTARAPQRPGCGCIRPPARHRQADIRCLNSRHSA